MPNYRITAIERSQRTISSGEVQSGVWIDLFNITKDAPLKRRFLADQFDADIIEVLSQAGEGNHVEITWEKNAAGFSNPVSAKISGQQQPGPTSAPASTSAPAPAPTPAPTPAPVPTPAPLPQNNRVVALQQASELVATIYPSLTKKQQAATIMLETILSAADKFEKFLLNGYPWEVRSSAKDLKEPAGSPPPDMPEPPQEELDDDIPF